MPFQRLLSTKLLPVNYKICFWLLTSDLFQQADRLLSDTWRLAVEVWNEEMTNQVHFLWSQNLRAPMALTNQTQGVHSHLRRREKIDH